MNYLFLHPFKICSIVDIKAIEIDSYKNWLTKALLTFNEKYSY